MKTSAPIHSHLEDSYRALESKQSLLRLKSSMGIVCFAGALAHLLFLFTFTLIGAMFMAILNIISVAIWIYAFAITKKGDYERAVYIVTLEMFLHAIIATYFVGTELGFQYYMWPLMALLLSLPSNKLKQSTFYCFITIATFVVVTLTMREIEYVYRLSHLINYIYSFNVFMAAAPFILALLYMRSNSSDNEKALFSQANMDLLTGTFNRRFVNDLMQTSVNEERRRRFDSYTLVLADIDNFQSINDNIGHIRGDELVKHIAEVLKNNVRDTDILCRWAGEEFLILLVNADTEITEKVLRKIKHGIKSDSQIQSCSENGVSMSFGASTSHDTISFEEILRQADLKLYQAKAAGTDRIVTQYS
ncbi:GGDEF domain-containing protein [Glaciecola sp. XM2]|uniref:GGDEF domain-containing protein n=1 Tax=Glaciecola sp. XM2 TaxID=1914931 RepID=UPI001BDF47DB|nr:GGDEF domain-containing protein [Glaciecola sp. XM2]MBT1450990.1 GGDEF domain-containing protein [Glaciecola sp. XM2]